jgi:hypothetical protein
MDFLAILGITATLMEKAQREEGIVTSIHLSDKGNAAIIQFILDSFFKNLHLQVSSRNEQNWTDVIDLPVDFGNFRYRIVP